jgi:DNA-binding IclR family transcriptional regulator
MTTTAKVLQVLRLFDDERRQLAAQDVVQLLGVSPATAYRYMADLEEAGFIERSGPSRYVLGPTVVQLDRQIRVHDPLIAAASEVMVQLSERSGGTALLSRLHSRCVMCVHQVVGKNGPTAVSYERGRAMPLYRGATSKVILAHLDLDELRRIASTDRAELRKAGLPMRFEELAGQLQALREEKVCATAGEVDRDVMGWAVALHQGRHLLGSLSVLISRHCPPANPERIADQLLRAALRIEGRLESAAAPASIQGVK